MDKLQEHFTQIDNEGHENLAFENTELEIRNGGKKDASNILEA